MLTFVPHKCDENYNKVEFYRVNKELCNSEVYKELSPTAILLYSLLCDKLSLAYSINKNNYSDKNKIMYVIFTRINLKAKLHVGKSAISSAFKQLENANLIKQEFQGRNRPNKIFVGKTISEINEQFINVKSENQTSGDSIFSTSEFRFSNTNKNNKLNIKNKKNGFANFEQRDYSNIDWDSFYDN